MRVQNLYFVECRRTGEKITRTYTSWSEARRGLKVMRGEFDGRGPKKGHTLRCLGIVRFRRS